MVDLASGLVPDSILALHGVAAEGIVVGTGGGWADGLDEVSDISTFELAGASYSRLTGTFSVERIGDEWRLFVEGFSAVDLSDSAARIGVWVTRSDTDRLVFFEDDPGAPTGTYLPAWPDGGPVRPIAPVTATGYAVPNPASGDDGDVVTVDGGVYVLAPQSGGGGGAATLAAPIDESGDSSPTIEVDLSGLDDTDVSVVILLASTCTSLELTMPDHARQPVTVTSAGGSSAGWNVEAVGGLSFTTGASVSSVSATFVPLDAGSLTWGLTGSPMEGS